MSVLVYIENPKGNFKKAANELIFFGRSVADKMNVECHAVVLGSVSSFDAIQNAGAHKIHHFSDNSFDAFDSQQVAKIVDTAANAVGAKVIVVGHTANGKSILGRVAVRQNAGSVSGVNTMPTLDGGFKIKKGVFSGKATAEFEIKSDVKVLSLMGNSFQASDFDNTAEIVTDSSTNSDSSVTITDLSTVEGTVPLPEAELVVSAGRGMKGPENWGIIDELANELGATTACSRPVADIGWRPHHEHVGQTGVAIRPNLYIAAGISGAIQHLAGVNQSKTIVVINKDPEAPFFKAADYGICADLFDVVPKITEALKKYKANN